MIYNLNKSKCQTHDMQIITEIIEQFDTNPNLYLHVMLEARGSLDRKELSKETLQIVVQH